MTAITFMQKSPTGTAVIHTERLLIGTDGVMFLRSGDGLVPVSEEQRDALMDNLGPILRDAIASVRALA